MVTHRTLAGPPRLPRLGFSHFCPKSLLIQTPSPRVPAITWLGVEGFTASPGTPQPLRPWLATSQERPSAERAPAPGAGNSGSSAPSAQSSRTLVAGIGSEPKTLAARLLQNAVSLHSRRLFNADLALRDDQSNALPYLAEALPQLNTDSW